MEKNKDMFDRLSSSLLVLILSYLPFKEAVRTCILSKRWRFLWRETTNLDFNENFMVKPEESEENQKIQRNVFIEFVRQLIENYPRKGIQRFAISCAKPDDFLTHMKNFVVFAVSHDVRELELDFSDHRWGEDDLDYHPAVLDLPLQAYQHKGLESLKLFRCNFNVSMFTNFNLVKNVSLGWIGIRMVSIDALLVNCPLLESLSLKKCWGLDHFEISMPNLRLKNLVIDKCIFIQDLFWIEGPKLKFLKYSGRIGHFHVFNQREIVEVDLDFGMEAEFDEVGSLLYYFVQELCSAQILTVCSVFLQMVAQGEEPFGVQSPLDVRHLILKTVMHFNEYCGIRFMLNSCPNLQILTFDICQSKIFSDYEPPFAFNPHEFWSKNLLIQRCINNSLEVVNVKGFKGSRSELYLLRYIIFFSRQLRELNLYISNEEGDNGENREIFMAKVHLVMQFSTRSKNLRRSIF